MLSAKIKILNTTLVLAVLFLAGCMKPMTNGQTVIDPSQESADPSEAYSPEVLKPEWRDRMSPKIPEGMETAAKDLTGTPKSQTRVTIRPGELPPPVLPDADDDDTDSDAYAPPSATTDGRAVPPVQSGDVNQGGAPATAATGVTASTGEGRKVFRTVPRPVETQVQPKEDPKVVIAPTGRQTVTAPTGTAQRKDDPKVVVAPTGRQAVVAPTGAAQRKEDPKVVVAPTGRQTVVAPTGRTTVTAPTGTAQHKDEQKVVTAPTGRQTVIPKKDEQKSGAVPVVAPTGQTKAEKRDFKTLPNPDLTPKKETKIPTPILAEREKPATQKETGHSVRIPDGRDIEKSGVITPTIFFVPVIDEDSASCDDKVGMHLMDGSVSMRICRRSASFCSEQGSCLIKKDGKWITLNVIKRVGGIDRYKIITDGCVYGYGVRNICLDPYYSVAADLSVYNPGDVIFIPKLRGTVLPNGKRHDGYFIVRDQGRGVKGQGRFDFFTGGESWSNSSNPFVKARLNDKGTDMDFQKVTGELEAQIKAKRGYPKLPVRAGTAQVAQYSGNTKGTPTSPLAQPGSGRAEHAASR